MQLALQCVCRVVFFLFTLQSLSLNFSYAGVKLDLSQEIQDTQAALQESVSPQEKQRLEVYLEILNKMTEPSNADETGIRKHPGQISLRLKSRLLKAIDAFGLMPTDIYNFFDSVEKQKKEWKKNSQAEGWDERELQPSLISSGPFFTPVLCLNRHLCVDQENELHRGSSAVAKEAILYDTWEPMVLLQKIPYDEGFPEIPDKKRKILIDKIEKKRANEKRVLKVLMQAAQGKATAPIGLPKIYGFSANAILMKRYQGDGFDLVNNPSISREQKIKFFIQTSYGLRWLHDHGIVHNDIKTENLLYDSEHAVYGDFDQSEFPHELVEKPRGEWKGTIGNMAPEIILHSWGSDNFEKKVENAFKADIYSHSLTWTEIFYGSETISKHLGKHEDLWWTKMGTLIAYLRQQTEDPIAQLLAQGLRRKPENRPSSREFLNKALTFSRSVPN